MLAIVALGVIACSDGSSDPSGRSADEATGCEAGAGHDVLLIGDSLAYAATEELQAEAAEHGIDLAIDAVPGRRIPEALPILETACPVDVVIALGTNDAVVENTRDDWNVGAVIDAVPGDRVWWVDTAVAYEATGEVNATIERAGEHWPERVRVIHWAEQVLRDTALLGPDGVHLSPRGYDVWAAMILDRVASG